jgi:methionyl-tRNA formyltransferase
VIRVAYAGTPALAATILQSLSDARYVIALVLTQPDRPAGRGLRVTESEVKKLASSRGLKVYQPESLKEAHAQAILRDTQADIMIVAAYGLILPPQVLALFPLGCINVHASLLPRWRGAAPIHRAILAGDAKTGVSIMKMEAGLDTGPVYLMDELAIDPTDTTPTLQDKLAQLGADALLRCLPGIIDGGCTPSPQSTSGVSYAAKISKLEAALDWSQDAVCLHRQVRAFHGYPVAHGTLRGNLVRIWNASPEPYSGAAPGQIVDIDRPGILVACGTGALRLTELQRAGSRRMNADEFVRGMQLQTSERFASH